MNVVVVVVVVVVVASNILCCVGCLNKSLEKSPCVIPPQA
jgi:hypothetical protein